MGESTSKAGSVVLPSDHGVAKRGSPVESTYTWSFDVWWTMPPVTVCTIARSVEVCASPASCVASSLSAANTSTATRTCAAAPAASGALTAVTMSMARASSSSSLPRHRTRSGPTRPNRPSCAMCARMLASPRSWASDAARCAAAMPPSADSDVASQVQSKSSDAAVWVDTRYHEVSGAATPFTAVQLLGVCHDGNASTTACTYTVRSKEGEPGCDAVVGVAWRTASTTRHVLVSDCDVLLLRGEPPHAARRATIHSSVGRTTVTSSNHEFICSRGRRRPPTRVSAFARAVGLSMGRASGNDVDRMLRRS
mmetsp:Transcript_10387/g.32859  ORF Transcript_10387/g.32859 Transcript_10387/m.32859 type:complete len:310 (-) Transcript_10387:212-1141(-)